QKKVRHAELETTIQDLDYCIAELRQISRNLMPESLLRSGLETALSDLCGTLANEELDIEFQSNGLNPGISVDIQVNAYRIVQELLTNAIRHGKATNIIVQCLQSRQGIYLTVEDNGSGFVPSDAGTSMGIGLR